MRYIAQELGRTVRMALVDWPHTSRFCVILIVFGLTYWVLQGQ